LILTYEQTATVHTVPAALKIKLGPLVQKAQ